MCNRKEKACHSNSDTKSGAYEKSIRFRTNCDPNAGANVVEYSAPDQYPDCNAFGIAHSDAHPDANADKNSDCNGNENSDGNPDENSDSDEYVYTFEYFDSDDYTNTDGNAFRYTIRHADTAS